MNTRPATCPSCGAAFRVRYTSESVVCPSCAGLCHVTDEGLQFAGEPSTRRKPALPIGSKGDLNGERLEVIGWVLRAFRDPDGAEYSWSEYLLHSSRGDRWLSECDGHWVYLSPSTSAVHVTRFDQPIEIDGQSFEHYQHSSSVYAKALQGEFTWTIRLDDRAELDDYIAPPSIACRESMGGHSEWTLGTSVTGAEVWRAFQVAGSPPERSGIGACQPNRLRQAAPRLIKPTGAFSVVLIACGWLLASLLPETRVLQERIQLSPSSPIYVSEPFEIAGSTHAAELQVRALDDLSKLRQYGASEAWLGVDMALINETTGAVDPVAFDLYDELGGDRVTEGVDRVGSIPPGRYVLRVETSTPPNATADTNLAVTVTHGTFLWFPLWLCFGMLWFSPLGAWALGRYFEHRRWQNSDYASGMGN